MRLLVTGGAGFIGSAVCRRMLGDPNISLICLDKMTYAAIPEAVAEFTAGGRAVVEKVDVADRAEVARVFRAHRPDAVMHLAAETHVDRSIDGPGAFVQTNIVGTYTMLETAREYWRGLDASARAVFRFHHISTDEVYGSLGPTGKFAEGTRYDPVSPYSASKAAADHLASAWHRTYGLPVVISNCSNNYGPYQFPEKLIPLTILNALEGLPLPVYGKGENVRDWLYVEDHAAALETVLRRGRIGEKYNVGGGAERRNIEVVRAICDLVDELAPGPRPRRELIAFVPDRPGHDLRYAIDAGKIQSELGWTPSVSFEQGLRRTVQWYLDHADWWRGIRARLYRGERLGLSPTDAA